MTSASTNNDTGSRGGRTVGQAGQADRISWYLYFDEWFVRQTLSGRLRKFCEWRIHPNVITGTALVLAVAIPVLHFRHLSWWVTIALVFRQFLDCLDGEVARCCGKTSRVGGLLDTIGDSLYAFAVVILFVSFLVPHPGRALIISSVSFGVFYAVHVSICRWSMLAEHTMKSYRTASLYKKGYAFLVNDSLIIALATAVLYRLFA